MNGYSCVMHSTDVFLLLTIVFGSTWDEVVLCVGCMSVVDASRNLELRFRISPRFLVLPLFKAFDTHHKSSRLELKNGCVDSRDYLAIG